MDFPPLSAIEQVVVTSVLHQLRAGFIESGLLADVQAAARLNLERMFVNEQIPWAGQC